MRIENDLLHEAAIRQLSLNEYKELLIILANTPKDYLKDSMSPTDLIKILSYMDFEDESVSDLAERISKLIFPLFPIDFIQESSEMLLSIFGVENYQLTLLIFKELTNVVKSFKSQGDIIIFTQEVLKQIFDLIFNQYLELSCSAQCLFTNYTDQSLDICLEIFQKIMKPKYKEISSNSVNFFRYIDVCVEILSKSKFSEIFEMAIDNDVIGMFNDIISKDDILAHLNVLEVIKKMTHDIIGYRRMADRHVLESLYKRLPAITDDPFTAILLPGYLSLFGDLCRKYPEHTLGQYGDFVSILTNAFGSDDASLKFQALEIFASFASDPACKLFIANGYQEMISKGLTTLADLLDSCNPDNKSRSANALSLLLSAPRDHRDLPALSSVTLRWCASTDLNDRLLAFICRAVLVPSESLRVAAYGLAAALSVHRWGQELLCDRGDLLDRLVSRDEMWQTCIDLKFEVVDNLVAALHQGGQRAFCSEEDAARLLRFHHEGKYFAARAQDVVMVDTDV